MADTAYDGQTGIPISFVFTPDTGTPFGSNIAQAEEMTPPDIRRNVPKITPISGANANSEEPVPGGTIPMGTVPIKATYSSEEHEAALTCFTDNPHGTLAVTYADGSVDTWDTAVFSGIKGSTINPNNSRSDDLEFSVKNPPAFTPA